MKTRFIALLLVLFGYHHAISQCTNPFYAYKDGTTITMENYDNKDKLTGSQQTKVINWKETSNGYLATVSYKIFDKKGKEEATGEYQLECKDGIIHMDMSAMIPQESMAAFEDMEVEMVMDQLEFPSELQKGDLLEDAQFAIETKGSPMAMKFTMDITDRVVQDKETITTPAGTFDCYVVSQRMSSKMMISKSTFRSITYLVEKYGAVKTETYRDNGKLMGYSLLTSFED